MASPESAPSTTPPPATNSSAPESTNSTSGSPPPASPPPSPPASPPPGQSPPPASSPPSSPPPSSPPPTSPPPPHAPPPKDSPPPSPTPSPPADSKSPPPSSPPPGSPPPPSSSTSPPPPTPPPPTGSSNPSPVFAAPPPGTISSPTPPSPAGKVTSPPPASGKLSSPPPPSKSSNTPSGSRASSPSSHDSTTNSIIIAAIVVGAVLFLALVIVCVLCTKKRKKQPYYIDTVRPPKPGDPYYNTSTPTQWNSPQDHIVKLPPPPGAMGTPSPLGAAGGGWGPPPPPPAANTSSEFSSGYSGQHNAHMPPQSPNMGGMGGGLGFSKSQFSYEELAAATGGFSQVNLLGQGGFGYVHKGVLPGGRDVAVKSLKLGSGQGEREFQAEVEIISRVHHRHLVSLVGYCIAEEKRMLVYEFVPNKTLEFHLHGKGQPVMDWATRLRIALGSAKGLAYLHEDCHPRIIHRDIKAANILLDDKYEAMVADFGLAKLSSDNYTHVSTRVMGTFGYLAPEYASSGKLSEKSDVFSFGVMLLELITGRKPVDPSSNFMEDSLVDWARPLLNKALEDGNYDELVDPRLEGNYIPHEMARMIACGSASIRHSARRRPRMSQIVHALEGDSSLEDLNDAAKAANAGFNSNGSAETQTYDTGMYNADMMKFRKMVMSSQEFASSEYGGTSEYGLNPSSSSSDDLGHSGQQRKKP